MNTILKVSGIALTCTLISSFVIRKKHGNLQEKNLSSLPGNDDKYAPENLKVNPNSPLKGKHICFLGSSVTYGAGSLGTSFVEDLAHRDGITYVKEAVNGTTLCDNGPSSYVERMLNNVSKNERFDLVVVQLSTNDARKKAVLGTVSNSFNAESFNKKTTIGAMEYLIAYIKETYHCPVLFYTGTYFKSKRYEQMVQALKEIQKKWSIYVLDFWDDPTMRAVSKEDYALYMSDPIHPTRAGYAKWWLPGFEEEMQDCLKS